MRSKQARLKLGKDGDILVLTLTPQYLHLRLTQPGRQFYIEEIYLPRTSLLGIIKWAVRSVGQVPTTKSVYPPDLVRRYLEKEELYYEGQRRMKREAGQAKRKRRRRPVG